MAGFCKAGLLAWELECAPCVECEVVIDGMIVEGRQLHDNQPFTVGITINISKLFYKRTQHVPVLLFNVSL
jgi:hypothetical protein